VTGTSKADTLSGTSGNDNIHGGAGNDTIHGSGGTDHLYGDAGNDTFTFGDISGHSTVDGGGGSGWTDVIEMDIGGGPGASAAHGGWTVEIDGHQISDNHAHGSIDTHGQSGHITTEHGTIDFTNIDKIDW
jgi:Ca2+-binding RTX toxin-like protein